jgi:hypothetical protein
LMVLMSQPRCSPRLLRVMKSRRNERSKLGPRASGTRDSGLQPLPRRKRGFWKRVRG